MDAILNHACGPLTENAYEEELDQLCCDLDVVPQKEKSNSGKKQRVAKLPKKQKKKRTGKTVRPMK